MKLNPFNTRIGLALGGGAAKGIAHIGVLKAFEEEQINDFAVGLPDAYELEIFDKELYEIKQRYKQAYCAEPIVYKEQLRLLDKDAN